MRAKTAVSILLACGMAVALSGCGSTPLQRTASGAGIGTAAGVGVAAIAGAPLLAGIAVGAVGGAVIGGATSECQIDVGPQRPNNC